MLSHPLVEGLLADERLQAVLADAPHAYLTIATRSGPHATPEVHLAWGGRIWLMVANDTVKAKVLRTRPQVGVLAQAGGLAVVVAGEARLLDPTRPGDVLSSVPEAMLSGAATLGYVSRNQRDLLGFVRDALSGELGTDSLALPLLVGVRPSAVALVEDGAVELADGEWVGRRDDALDARATDGEWVGRPDEALDAQATHGERGVAQAPLDDVPADTAALLDAPRPCVVGWDSASGPLGLPGTWDPGEHRAQVPSQLFSLAALPLRSEACVTVDVVQERHPAGKRGLVLRGPGAATPAAEHVEVHVRADRITWWRGKQVETKTLD